MKEFSLEIEIDEGGNIIAETKGITGTICETELDAILEGIEGERDGKRKPEYYQPANAQTRTTSNKA